MVQIINKCLRSDSFVTQCDGQAREFSVSKPPIISSLFQEPEAANSQDDFSTRYVKCVVLSASQLKHMRRVNSLKCWLTCTELYETILHTFVLNLWSRSSSEHYLFSFICSRFSPRETFLVKMRAFWDIAPCSLVTPIDGGSTHLSDVGLLQWDYTATLQKALIFIIVAVRTLNLTFLVVATFKWSLIRRVGQTVYVYGFDFSADELLHLWK
jgi:hypothetical protein